MLFEKYSEDDYEAVCDFFHRTESGGQEPYKLELGKI